MVGASKILTVSYGTFSCTLEGFDDPFSTMKSIAEYFRDLAADDRYFGAEPPTPDAAMLHQIAEREIHRRVEAKVQEQGVLLRAAPAAPLAAPEPVDAAPVAAAPVAPQPAPEPAAKPAAESIAAKLQRIRAAVDHARQAAPVAEAEPADELSEDLEEPAPAAPFAPVAAAAAAVLAAEALPAVAEAEPAAPAEEPAAAPQIVAEAVAEAETVAEPVAEPETVAEVAAEPEVIAAPVAEAAAEPEAVAAPLEAPEAVAAPEAEPAAAPAPVRSLEDTIGNIMAGFALDAAPAAEIVPPAPQPVEEAPAPRARVIKVRRVESEEPGGAVTIETSRHLPEVKPEAPAPVDAEPVASTLSADQEAELQAELAELEREMGLPAAEAAVADVAAQSRDTTDLAAESPEEISEAEEAPAAEEIAAAPEAETIAAAEEVAPEAAAPLAAEIDDEDDDVRPYAEMAETPVAEADAIDAPAPDAETPDAPAADPLAARIGDFTGAVAAAKAVEAVEPRSFLAGKVETDHKSLDRLMQQADTELGEPEARRRQATLAHLKAAVAATQAEKELGAAPDADGAADLDRYRNDLAEVVRPRRPITPGSMTLRPSAQPDKPAPLVLVSEQRVDAPANPEPLVIRPRRISSSNVVAITAEEDEDLEDGSDEAGNIFANAKSFADFAERIGATELPDLLEAAAAYAACVEGRPHFSRPQILRSAAAAAGAEVSREQSLRSFGMLLRQGKIQKVKRGQFAIAESSRYLPEARKIAR